MADGRTCLTCGEFKSLEELALSATSKFGREPRCKMCSNAQSAEWTRNNPDKHRERVARYRAEHPEVLEKAKETRREYDRAHPEIVAFRNKERRARRANARDGSLTRSTWTEILNLYDNSCAYCGSTERITMDHVVPLIKGGKHSIDNVVPACYSCNCSKRDRDAEDFKLKLLDKERKLR